MTEPQSPQLVTYDPIQRFPYDIWTECIKFAMGGDAAGPLSYLTISSHWYQVLIEAPSLWTTIVIENGADEAARIYTFLHLSRNSFLDVIFRTSINTLLSTLEANASRIRSIRVSELNLESEKAIFDIGYSLPALQIFNAGAQVIPSNFLLRCPNLKTIISALVNIGDWHLLNPATQDVNFSGVTSDNIHEISLHMKYRSLGINFGVNYMSNLVDYIDLRWSGTLEYLAMHLGTCLENLSMTISSTQLSTLILYTQLLYRLHTLNLAVFLSYQEEPDEVIFAEGIQHVRSVMLRIRSIGDRTHESKALDMILEALHKARFLQNLEEFYIYSDVECNVNQLGTCLQSAWNVRKITVYTDLHQAIPEKPTFDSSPMIMLESLTVNCLPILHYIDAVNPISLRLVRRNKLYTLREKKFDFQVARCDDNNMLKSLDPVNQGELLHGCRTIVFQGSFKLHLTMIFSGLVDVDLSGDFVEMFEFLSGILQNPDICSCLHTIRMATYPFWEQLFAVMRQRLAGNVTPIKRVVLLGLPCAYLLSHTTRLLKGNPVFTASDVDVIISKRHLSLAL